MTRVFGFLFLASIVAVVAHAAMKDEFEAFKAKHGKTYSTAAEEHYRFLVFSKNMNTAAALQEVNPLATFGASPFADLTEAEFKQHHNADYHFAEVIAERKQSPKTFADKIQALANGSAIDWRTKGAVTGVKNQAQCGSCWSFSTTGNIEGQWFLAGNTLTSLSEQELVSCDTTDDGCNGGLMTNAFGWLINNKDGWIVTEASYPYVSGGGNVPACDMSGRVNGAQIYSFVNVASNEDQMAAYCYANGPVSIGVDATSWQTYTGGILTNCISDSVDHGVLIVGFDDSNSPPYWIIKNSWGPTWGESGYIRVEKGTDQCLITSAPSSSKVHKAGPQPPSPPGPTPAPAEPTPAPAQPTPAPAQPTPAPQQPTPAPNAPGPQPGDWNVSIGICEDDCTNCQWFIFAQGACVDETFSQQSMTIKCYDGGKKISGRFYESSQQCSGSSTQQDLLPNTCYQNTNSGTYDYIQFICPSW